MLSQETARPDRDSFNLNESQFNFYACQQWYYVGSASSGGPQGTPRAFGQGACEAWVP